MVNNKLVCSIIKTHLYLILNALDLLGLENKGRIIRPILRQQDKDRDERQDEHVCRVHPLPELGPQVDRVEAHLHRVRGHERGRGRVPRGGGGQRDAVGGRGGQAVLGRGDRGQRLEPRGAEAEGGLEGRRNRIRFKKDFYFREKSSQVKADRHEFMVFHWKTAGRQDYCIMQ